MEAALFRSFSGSDNQMTDNYHYSLPDYMVIDWIKVISPATRNILNITELIY